MNTDDKQAVQDANRWLRITAITLTMLSPVINSLAARLRERAVAMREEAAKNGNSTSPQSQGRLMSMGASLADALVELKDSPYSKQLLKEGSLLSNKLAERSSNTARNLTKRVEQVPKEVSRSSEKMAKEVAKRSQKATKEAARRAQQASRKLAKQSKRQVRNISEQSNTLWTVLGFGVGLTAAGIGAYVLLKRRSQHMLQQNQQVQISQNGSLNSSSNKASRTGETRSIGQSSSEATTPTISTTEPAPQPEASPERNSIPVEGTMSSLPALDDTSALTEGEHVVGVSEILQIVEQIEHSTPATSSAAFLGVVTTKRYYPIETPLSQLESPEDGALDIVYFSSENEARSQGYSSAE